MPEEWRHVTPWGLGGWIAFLIGCGIIAAVVIAVALVFRLVFRTVGGDHHWATLLRGRLRYPLSGVIVSVMLWANLDATVVRPGGHQLVRQIFVIAVILTTAWLIGAVLVYVLDVALAHYAADGSEGWRARRARTQFLIVRRLAVAAMVILAVGAALLTFPGVRGVGATVLASAGLVSVVLGVAAQSTLGNVFAGIQLAFSGALRLEDTVVVDEAWGYVEEITLTYVVVQIWDERRLVLPTTFFTQSSYENWTRKGRNLLRAIYLDLDWGVDIARMRAELESILADTDLWDGGFQSLRITDQTGGYVRVRVLLSAANSEIVWDLIRYVREELLTWLQRENPEGVPRTRIQSVQREGESFAHLSRGPRASPRAAFPSIAGPNTDRDLAGDGS
jgi:small-conductance mechanosensitive channel